MAGLNVQVEVTKDYERNQILITVRSKLIISR